MNLVLLKLKKYEFLFVVVVILFCCFISPLLTSLCDRLFNIFTHKLKTNASWTWVITKIVIVYELALNRFYSKASAFKVFR